MSDDNTNRDAEPSPASAGSQPVAWAAVRTDGEFECVREFEDEAREYAAWVQSEMGGQYDVLPLYASDRCPHIRGKTTHYCSLNFTLTDEEREVLLAVADDAAYRSMDRTEQVVRGLLERLG
jgi:hypothetical protein